jgi:[protein-PII] uridylyltransferase
MAGSFDNAGESSKLNPSSVSASVRRSAFLGRELLQEAEALLIPPGAVPDGSMDQRLRWTCYQVSDFLSKRLLESLNKDSAWQESEPLLLGSWARGELCPKSDLDVLFLGDEETVGAVVAENLKKGIRLRSRLPENFSDWSQGVEFQDLLSLFQAKALNGKSKALLETQKKKIFSSRKKRSLVQKLLKERRERGARFESLANYLEPNIKYGTGGLRDLEQGLLVMALFPEIFENSEYEKRILEYYKAFFLTLRQKLHFSGHGDVLIGSEQIALAEWFGFDDHKEFMRQIQRGISRVSFYSDWMIEQALKPQGKTKELKKPKEALRLLLKQPSVLHQYAVRRKLTVLFRKKISEKEKGQLLEKIFSAKTEDEALVAVFRSRLIDYLCPRMVRLVGYVQHDQYHRLTADAHILQALREVKILFAKPKELGALSELCKDFSAKDFSILMWTALYHDLGKGLPQDHSQLGEAWVREDLQAYGLAKAKIDEVAWLVKNHLVLSRAAFRKNPNDPKTWEELFDLGADKDRVRRLAIFTAADIRATNIDAWTPWKSELLAKVLRSWLEGSTQNFLAVRKKLPRAMGHVEIEKLDLQLFEVFSPQMILKDLSRLHLKEASVRVLKDRNKKIWVRFYTPVDEPGLLLKYLELLYSFGCSVQHALVHTLDGLGVYDWFQISSSRRTAQLQKWLQGGSSRQGAVQIPAVKFLEIDLVSQTPSEWVIGFRGTDQKGCLLAATSKISGLGAEILSARVHTWGRQIDDLFHIRPPQVKPAEFLAKLRSDLGTPYLSGKR